MKTTRRTLLLGLLLATAGCAAITSAVLQARSTDPSVGRPLPNTVPPDDPATAYLRFLAVGDWGTGGQGQRAVADALVRRADRVAPDLVLLLGDNFYPDGVTSVDDSIFRERFEAMYLRGTLARVPFFPVLGNHDYRGNPGAQVEYARRQPQWVMPARYHAFTRELGDGTSVQFIALDTDPLVEGEPEGTAQLAWLKETLTATTPHWRFVFGHHPLYSSGVHGNSPTLQRLIEDLLVQHGVQVVFTGHDHHLELHKPVRGIFHVVSGAGAGLDRPYPVDWSDDAFYTATRGGFVAGRVDRQRLVLEFIRPDARTQFAFTIPRCGENTTAPCP